MLVDRRYIHLLLLLAFQLVSTAEYYNGSRPYIDTSPPTLEAVAHHRKLISTENFDWKAYLGYNKDLTAQGINTEAAAVSHFVTVGHKEGRRYNKVMPGMENFDWRSYLQLNPDLYKAGLNTENHAWSHYRAIGVREGRHSHTTAPMNASFEAGLQKLHAYIQSKRDLDDIPIEKTNFVLYHLEDVESSANSIAVTFNNVKLFASAVKRNDIDVFAAQNAFYWINVASVSYNPLADLFPVHNLNVALVNWEIDGGQMNAHIDTLKRLSPIIMADFSAVFFSSSGVRGPFEKRGNGEWLGSYRSLLEANNVGVVGATLACSPKPHIQTHFFGVRSTMVPHMLSSVNDNYLNMELWVSLDDFFEMEMTDIARKQGFEVASMLHYSRLGTPYFQGDCYNDTHLMEHTSHLASMREWCHVAPSEVNFVRWSGESLGARGYPCNKAIATDADSVSIMEEEMTKIASAEANTQIELSEALTGGQLFDLYQSYTEDFWRHRNISVVNNAKLQVTTDLSEQALLEIDKSKLISVAEDADAEPKVCFLVRTSKAHDPALTTNSKAKYGMLQMDIDGNIKTLLRQTNSNWKAFYFLTEKPVFSKRLRAILSSFEDTRLVYFPVEARYRSKNEDHGTAALNQLLTHLRNSAECRWVSVTSANIAYGSEVVDRVLQSQNVPGTNVQPDILLAPMDSKHFAKQDYIARKESRWDQRCVGVEGMLRHNLLAYTIQPVPYPGRVDLASAFLSREKLVQDNIKFDLDFESGNVSYRSKTVCTTTDNCDDGYFLQHLVRSKFWSYNRLALDGLKTIVFQENSPTLCIASGNVWFDYPHLSNVGCISHKTLYLLSQKDTSRSAFDWQSFHEGDRLCLRLSNLGFSTRVNAARKAQVVSKNSKQRNSRALQEMSAPSAAVAPAASLPEDFNWKEYLALNPDLQADGLIFKAAVIEHYLSFGTKEGRPYYKAYPEMEKFDWRAYLELNSDVPMFKQNEQGALFHFKNTGKDEGRPFMPAEPEPQSWDAAMSKLGACIKGWNAKYVKMEHRNLVIYNVEDVDASENSIEVTTNNLRMFVAAVMLHGAKSTNQAFYLFNFIGEPNQLSKEVPVRPNVASVRWKVSSSDLYTHLRTLQVFRPELISNFSAVFFTGTGVRGPVIYNRDGEWLGEYRKLLDYQDVGMVGATVSCRGVPHVQTHFFGLRLALVPVIISEVLRYESVLPWKPALEYFSTELSAAVLRANYQLSSKLSERRLQQVVFDRNCTSSGEFAVPSSFSWEYRSWCELEAQDVIFVRWGGEPLGSDTADRYLCDKAIDMNDLSAGKMEDTMVDIANSVPGLQFILPEGIHGGLLYDLFKQYRMEMWKDRKIVNHDSNALVAAVHSSNSKQQEDSKVCFLIRASIRDDPQRVVRSKPEMKEMDLASLIQSLLRQTDMNWLAYFFVTDQVPFENRLRKILNNYADKRLQYVPLDHAHRPAFTRVDAGYTATDYVTNLLKNKRECRFLSITNADNVYGSDVVANVLNYSVDKDSRGKKTPPDMLLSPLDSRNFAEHDYHKRQESELSDRCKGLHSMLQYNLLTYTSQPIPFLGRVDLAAVFLHRRKFASENILFGNFTNPTIYPCVGCQDGYLTQYLVRARRWKYYRMPLDGLKSIVFHGPSPTWCVAAGNVWFDYPHVNKVGCFTHETVSYLKQIENPQSPTFDWENFQAVGRKCLRLSKTGFLNKAIGK